MEQPLLKILLIATSVSMIWPGALIIVPLWRILARAGLPPYLALVSIVPLLGHVVVEGLLAFTPWPGKPDARQRVNGTP